jgi:hypothetical protein
MLASFLEEIEIASPCSADWAKMEGDDRVRFCKECRKNVYNISTLSRSAAEQLVRETEGVSCVRLYRRPDGTVITNDCPVGAVQGMSMICRTLGGLAIGVAMIIAALAAHFMDKDTDSMAALRRIEPFATVINWIWPSPPAPPPSGCTMGKMRAPPGSRQ